MNFDIWVYNVNFNAKLDLIESGLPKPTYNALMVGSLNVIKTKTGKYLILGGDNFKQTILCTAVSSNPKIDKAFFSSSIFNCNRYNNNKPPIIELQT